MILNLMDNITICLYRTRS